MDEFKKIIIEDAVNQAFGITPKSEFIKIQSLMNDYEKEFEAIVEELEGTNSLPTLRVEELFSETSQKSYEYIGNIDIWLENNMVAVNVEQAMEVAGFYAKCIDLQKRSAVVALRDGESNNWWKTHVDCLSRKSEACVKNPLRDIIHLLDIDSVAEFEEKFDKEYSNSFPLEMKEEIFVAKHNSDRCVLEA